MGNGARRRASTWRKLGKDPAFASGRDSSGNCPPACIGLLTRRCFTDADAGILRRDALVIGAATSSGTSES